VKGMDVEKVLKKALKGKVYLGSKRTIKALKRGEASTTKCGSLLMVI